MGNERPSIWDEDPARFLALHATWGTPDFLAAKSSRAPVIFRGGGLVVAGGKSLLARLEKLSLFFVLGVC